MSFINNCLAQFQDLSEKRIAEILQGHTDNLELLKAALESGDSGTVIHNTGGTTYYVDGTAGDDSNNGTSAGTAWKTLTKVSEELSFKTFTDPITINVAAGDYLPLTIEGFKGILTMTGNPDYQTTGMSQIFGQTVFCNCLGDIKVYLFHFSNNDAAMESTIEIQNCKSVRIQSCMVTNTLGIGVRGLRSDFQVIEAMVHSQHYGVAATEISKASVWGVSFTREGIESSYKGIYSDQSVVLGHSNSYIYDPVTETFYDFSRATGGQVLPNIDVARPDHTPVNYEVVLAKGFHATVADHLNGIDEKLAYVSDRFFDQDAVGYIYLDALNGNDSSGDGSYGSPYATIGKAFELLSNTNRQYPMVISLAPTMTYVDSSNVALENFSGELMIDGGSVAAPSRLVFEEGLVIRDCNFRGRGLEIANVKFNHTNVNPPNGVLQLRNNQGPIVVRHSDFVGVFQTNAWVEKSDVLFRECTFDNQGAAYDSICIRSTNANVNVHQCTAQVPDGTFLQAESNATIIDLSPESKGTTVNALHYYVEEQAGNYKVVDWKASELWDFLPKTSFSVGAQIAPVRQADGSYAWDTISGSGGSGFPGTVGTTLVYYVSPTGNDANDGLTDTSPKQNLQLLLDELSGTYRAGDVRINLMEGVHEGNYVLQNFAGYLMIAGHNPLDFNVVIRGSFQVINCVAAVFNMDDIWLDATVTQGLYGRHVYRFVCQRCKFTKNGTIATVNVRGQSVLNFLFGDCIFEGARQCLNITQNTRVTTNRCTFRPEGNASNIGYGIYNNASSAIWSDSAVWEPVYPATATKWGNFGGGQTWEVGFDINNLQAKSPQDGVLYGQLDGELEPIPTFKVDNPAGTTYYIDGTTGNDSNDGLTAGAAFRTWAKARSLLEGMLFTGPVIVEVAPGTYDEPMVLIQYTGRTLRIQSAGAGASFDGLYFSSIRSVFHVDGINSHGIPTDYAATGSVTFAYCAYANYQNFTCTGIAPQGVRYYESSGTMRNGTISNKTRAAIYAINGRLVVYGTVNGTNNQIAYELVGTGIVAASSLTAIQYISQLSSSTAGAMQLVQWGFDVNKKLNSPDITSFSVNDQIAPKVQADGSIVWQVIAATSGTTAITQRIQIESSAWDASGNYTWNVPAGTLIDITKEPIFGLPVPTTQANAAAYGAAQLLITAMTAGDIIITATTIPTTTVEVTLQYWKV